MTNIGTDRHKDRWANKQSGRQIERKTDRKAGWQVDRKVDWLTVYNSIYYKVIFYLIAAFSKFYNITFSFVTIFRSLASIYSFSRQSVINLTTICRKCENSHFIRPSWKKWRHSVMLFHGLLNNGLHIVNLTAVDYLSQQYLVILTTIYPSSQQSDLLLTIHPFS